VERRLAAVLAFDIVGYSRLMERDEAGTLAALQTLLSQYLEPEIARHHGRVVKHLGDGAIIEFGSAVNAVQCAVEMQDRVASANADRSDDQRLILRIGINLGDVMVDRGDLFGDGVNIAVRIEGLAEPGGVHIAQAVFDQIQGKVTATFEDTGEHKLKNISKPVRVYRLRGAASAKSVAPHSPDAERPGRPSIAVLPFLSLGGDAEQRHLADGISEDIITELARYTSLFVIARNSSFVFREQPVDVRRAGRELGARYLVEGSLRRLGPQIRIAAQLIDVESGGHLWAERYDRRNEDLFTLQDEVVRAIVVATANRIADREEERRLTQPAESWLAYDYVLHARQCLARDTYLPAEEPLRRAIQLDPGIAEAHALLVYVLLHKYWFLDERRHLDEALASAQKATELNSQGSGPRFALGLVNSCLGQYELAGLQFDRAIALNPNNAQARIARAQWLIWGGKGEEALAELDSSVPAVSLAPSFYWEARGEILFQLRRYAEAIEAFSKLDRGHYFWVQAFIMAALAQLGRVQEARNQLAALLGDQPGVTIARVLKVEVYKDTRMREHLVEGLRKAGMPES
jgi:TolB-like protein/class 3 adenylate cyclase